jgi:hypothetical protein
LSRLQFEAKEDIEDSMRRIQHSGFQDGGTIKLSRGYRDLHDALWMVVFSPPCQHPSTSKKIRLGLEGTTANCLDWAQEREATDQSISVPARVCVLLVKGDKRSRWLAVYEAAQSKCRRTLLRRKSTCEDCAIDFVVRRQGLWLVII